MHYLAVISFFVSAVASLCVDSIFFFPHSHQIHYFLQLLFIGCMILIVCIADLSGATANVWHPVKPTRPIRDEQM